MLHLPSFTSFREWAHWQSVDKMRALLGPTAAESETRLGGLLRNAPPSACEESLRPFDNVARFLHALATSRGLLVFGHDSHWADQGTLLLLH
jgi:hypothetical protein